MIPANVAISDIKGTFFGPYISAAECIGVSSTTFTQSASKATEFGEITQPLGQLHRSMSFKVTDFGTNRKLMRLPISD